MEVILVEVVMKRIDHVDAGGGAAGHRHSNIAIPAPAEFETVVVANLADLGNPFAW